MNGIARSKGHHEAPGQGGSGIPSRLPLVLLVGAPNVGKSRLFNRLTGGEAIVHDRPGVTRDRIEGICEWTGHRFRLMDSGGWIPGEDDELTGGVERQVRKGMEGAALLLFVVDGRAGLTPLDQSLAHIFRKCPHPVLLAVNKVDAEGQESRVAEFFSLGFSDPLAISAEEGRGLNLLMDRILENLERPGISPTLHPPESAPEAMKLAIVGRPNVGKSTLFNQLAGEERALVSSLPGTTRDPVEAEFSHAGRRYQIVDTAGLRRRARVGGEEVESQSVERALEAMKRADLVVVVLDATEPATHQDLAVIGACQRVRRPVIVALNKVDLLPPSGEARETLRREVLGRLRFAESPPLLSLSALQRRGIGELLDLLERMAGETSRRISTPELNRALETAVRRRSPAGKESPPRLYYITQTGGRPPSFIVFTNGATIQPSYRRYLARQLREALGLGLVPVSIRFRKRSRESL